MERIPLFLMIGGGALALTAVGSLPSDVTTVDADRTLLGLAGGPLGLSFFYGTVAYVGFVIVMVGFGLYVVTRWLEGRAWFRTAGSKLTLWGNLYYFVITAVLIVLIVGAQELLTHEFFDYLEQSDELARQIHSN